MSEKSDTTAKDFSALAFGDNQATFSLSQEVYPLDIVYGASFRFIDRCYVYLDRQDDRFVVRLRGKETLENGELEALQGEFENELLNQAMRTEINKRNAKLRELILAKAIFAGTNPDMLNEVRTGFADKLSQSSGGQGEWEDTSKEEQEELEKLLAEIEEDLAEDPLGIAIPWDEKYGKTEKAKEEAAEAPAEEATEATDSEAEKD